MSGLEPKEGPLLRDLECNIAWSEPPGGPSHRSMGLAQADSTGSRLCRPSEPWCAQPSPKMPSGDFELLHISHTSPRSAAVQRHCAHVSALLVLHAWERDAVTLRRGKLCRPGGKAASITASSFASLRAAFAAAGSALAAGASRFFLCKPVISCDSRDSMSSPKLGRGGSKSKEPSE